MNFLPEYTVKYKTHLKRTIQQGLAAAFKAHPDPKLRTSANNRDGVKVTLEWPHTESHYPAVVIRYYGRRVERMGVGHEELIYVNEDATSPIRMFHNLYEGDIEFAVSALSSYDRDLMTDTLVQIVTMGELEGWTNLLLDKVYPGYLYPVTDEQDGYPNDGWPDAHWHTVSINTDKIQEFGETQGPTPWGSEDEQIYNVSLRMGVLGEFYSVPPSETVPGTEFITEVDVYPWIKNIDPIPEGDPANTNDWHPVENNPE